MNPDLFSDVLDQVRSLVKRSLSVISAHAVLTVVLIVSVVSMIGQRSELKANLFRNQEVVRELDDALSGIYDGTNAFHEYGFISSTIKLKVKISTDNYPSKAQDMTLCSLYRNSFDVLWNAKKSKTYVEVESEKRNVLFRMLLIELLARGAESGAAETTPMAHSVFAKECHPLLYELVQAGQITKKQSDETFHKIETALEEAGYKKPFKTAILYDDVYGELLRKKTDTNKALNSLENPNISIPLINQTIPVSLAIFIVFGLEFLVLYAISANAKRVAVLATNVFRRGNRIQRERAAVTIADHPLVFDEQKFGPLSLPQIAVSIIFTIPCIYISILHFAYVLRPRSLFDPMTAYAISFGLIVVQALLINRAQLRLQRAYQNLSFHKLWLSLD